MRRCIVGVFAPPLLHHYGRSVNSTAGNVDAVNSGSQRDHQNSQDAEIPKILSSAVPPRFRADAQWMDNQVFDEGTGPALSACGARRKRVIALNRYRGREENVTESIGRSVCSSFQPGSRPLALITRAASGVRRYWINALAASGCFAPVSIPVRKTKSDVFCNSGGSGPT
jgi:hypothetical protein